MKTSSLIVGLLFADAYIITVCQPSSCLSLACAATVPVNSDVGDALIDLVDNAAPALAEWGTVSRVPRISKPPTRGLTQPCLVSIHGLAA